MANNSRQANFGATNNGNPQQKVINPLRQKNHNLSTSTNIDNHTSQTGLRSAPNRWNFSTTASRAWSEVVKGNNIPTSILLKFYQPRELNSVQCAKMSDEVVLKAKKQWDNAIVVYIVGPKPYYPFFKDYIHRFWKPVEEFSTYSKENGFYVIKFNNKQDCDKILEGGSYYYNKKLMMMKRWSLGMQLNKELRHSIPIWIVSLIFPRTIGQKKGLAVLHRC